MDSRTFSWTTASLASLLTAAVSLSVVSPAKAKIEAVPLESARTLSYAAAVREILLDGEWQAGIGTESDRNYDRVLHVPGLATDPAKPTPGTLWYKRIVDIPAGDWTAATLTLKGARFAPKVFVDGQQVSSSEGGMAATIHRFPLPAGKSFTLEIALESIKDLDK